MEEAEDDGGTVSVVGGYVPWVSSWRCWGPVLAGRVGLCRGRDYSMQVFPAALRAPAESLDLRCVLCGSNICIDYS